MIEGNAGMWFDTVPFGRLRAGSPRTGMGWRLGAGGVWFDTGLRRTMVRLSTKGSKARTNQGGSLSRRSESLARGRAEWAGHWRLERLQWL